MIVILKTVEKDNITFSTFSSEEEALKEIEDSTEYEDVELLVNIAEVKNYKKKYEEIYAELFNSFTGKERNRYQEDDDMLIYVKYSSGSEKSQRLKTFISIDAANEFIEEFDIDENVHAEMLVNISEVKDYKDKYEEFYQLMLTNYVKDKNVEDKKIF